MATDTGQQIGQKQVEEIIAGALQGFGHDIQSLQNTSQEFAQAYEQFSPESKRVIKLAQDNLKKEGEFLERRRKAIEKSDKEFNEAMETDDAAAHEMDELQRRDRDRDSQRKMRTDRDTQRAADRLQERRQNEANERFRNLPGPDKATMAAKDQASIQQYLRALLNQTGGGMSAAQEAFTTDA
jgi:hypothetical protein